MSNYGADCIQSGTTRLLVPSLPEPSKSLQGEQRGKGNRMTELAWTERKVSRAIAGYYGTSQNLVLPNYASGLVGYEADLVIVRDSGWAEEIEVKISAADFRAEFKDKPEKHRLLVEGLPTYVRKPFHTVAYCEARGDEKGLAEHEAWAQAELSDKVVFHENHLGALIGGHDWGNTKPHFAKKYWFAMPLELAEKLVDQIPEYAGLYSVNPGLYGLHVKVIKPAPTLKHCKKVDEKKRIHILQCAYHRFWSIENTWKPEE